MQVIPIIFAENKSNAVTRSGKLGPITNLTIVSNKQKLKIIIAITKDISKIFILYELVQ
jgi:hypothetical protein